VAASPAPRPARALAVLAVVVIALGAWMAVSGHTTPKLGLDLKGGTSVTLIPRVPNGERGTVNTALVDQAVRIIENRVNGLGVAEATVTRQGTGSSSTINISVPGATDNSILQLVGETAKLDFRPVLEVGGPAPTTGSPTPSASAKASPSARATAGAHATASAAASATPTVHPSASPAASTPASATPQAAGVTPAEQAQFNALNCTKAIPAAARPADVATQNLVTCARDGSEKFVLAPVAVAGAHINSATASLDTTTGTQWVVNVTFDSSGSAQFAQVTSELYKKTTPLNQLAIVLDAQVVSAPAIQNTINGTAQISGNFSQSQATDLANVLKYGALPLAFTTGQLLTVSPTLGSDQLKAGILAGLLGLLLVVLYSLLYYRGLGLVTIGSLTVAGVLTYELLVLLGQSIGYTLTLAGVAGAIVAIGITADSFVVYFERIRDELRDGRSMRVAVDAGWKRARRTILAADAVQLIAAVVLYVVSIGSVRGFAFTLGLTTLIDIVVVFLFTRPLLVLAARTKFFSEGHRLSGVEQSRRRHRTTSLPEPAPQPAGVGAGTSATED